MHLNSEVRETALKRLKSVKGHVEGIVRMLEDDSVYCVDVLKQIKAVEGGLARVGDMVLQSHLKHHVVTAHDRGDADKIVSELMDVLKYR
ncbi:MAG TPA: metal-sensitive transcriptional regulator [Pseudolabrys sp.]|jgi:DNA-binding FrmR family transcriptional regulator|nr:metal-sensitive transcriptional regulator [Pseudolabrys sp.]